MILMTRFMQKISFSSVLYYYHHHDPIPDCFHLSWIAQSTSSCMLSQRQDGTAFQSFKIQFLGQNVKTVKFNLSEWERARIHRLIPDRGIGCDSSRSSNLSNLIAGVSNLSSDFTFSSPDTSIISPANDFSHHIFICQNSSVFWVENYRRLVLITGIGHQF